MRKAGEGGVIEKIADLVKAGTLTEVPMSDEALQDHSDKEGMRIYVELKRDAIPQVALNKLFKLTPLQTTFGYNAVALVDGVPKTLSLLELVRHYLDYQREIVTRRSKYELRQAERRAHVLEGYLKALDNLDAVIALIRAAADTDDARSGLMEQFELSEIQAQAILDLRLSRLTGLARKEIEEEFKDLQERITELRAILGDPAKVDGVIKDELAELVTGYAKDDERRTEIVAGEDELELEDLIAEEDMVIAITRSGYVKRLPVSAYREQRRGGIGVMGMDLKDEDYIEHLFVASTHDYLLFFTTVGKVYRLKVHELPLGTRQSKGRAIVNLLPFAQDEQVKAVIATREFKEAEYLVLATRKGMVKKTRFEEYNTPLKADGIIAIKLRDGDALVDVLHSSGTDDIMLVSRKGQAIRFAEQNARPMGRATSGVKGMSLRKGDEVIAAAIARDDLDMLVVTDQGYGKRTRMARLPGQGPRRARREDGPADGGTRPACGRGRGPGGRAADRDLDRRDRDQDVRQRDQAARPRHTGRDRRAAPQGRAGLQHRACRRVRGRRGGGGSCCRARRRRARRDALAARRRRLTAHEREEARYNFQLRRAFGGRWTTSCTTRQPTSLSRSRFPSIWTSSSSTSGRCAGSPESRRCSSTTGRTRPTSRPRVGSSASTTWTRSRRSC